MALPLTDAETMTACWEERPEVCGEIRLALAEVTRRTPEARVHGNPRGRRQGPSSVGKQQMLVLLLLLTAWGQSAVQLLQCTASLRGGSGQCNSCNALPHCLGEVGCATPAIHVLALVTKHQPKNPQDGSCGTDCPHALPTSNSVVIRRGSLCVFPVSGRLRPPPNRPRPLLGPEMQSCGGKRTYMASNCRRMPTWRRLSGKVPPWYQR